MKKAVFLIVGLLSVILLHSQNYNLPNLIFGTLPLANKISYPVNHGSMVGYYDAQPFGGPYSHLGADINGSTYGNSDEGDTIYSIGNGQVVCLFEGNYGDGRNDCHAYIIEILHKTRRGLIISQYRHCKEVFIVPDQRVTYLQPIATIGTECGHFLAHLHFEIRTDLNILIGGGYGNSEGFVDPMKFIKDYNK
jgi:murein DD-endopeptidase MepM/ murein hydrolase activator NlpD